MPTEKEYVPWEDPYLLAIAATRGKRTHEQHRQYIKENHPELYDWFYKDGIGLAETEAARACLWVADGDGSDARMKWEYALRVGW